MLSLALLAVIACLVIGPVVAQEKGEMVTNPHYHGWKDFKKGTTATMEEKTVYHDESEKFVPGGVDFKTVHYKLLEVTPEKAVVETRVIDHDFLSSIESAKTKITYPAKVDKAAFEAVVHDVGAKLTDAEVEVLGKKVMAKVFTGTHKIGPEETMKKITFSKDVPGGIVERVTTVKRDGKVVTETTVKIKEFKAAE
jgi:hypothetical protein